MAKGFIFSWAQNAEGRIVHVDSVPNGRACNCICPNCHEPLLARHGEVNEHGFAHHSEVRAANLENCYMVVLYKLAEQIVQTHRQIYLPSYFGIFKKGVIEFKEVEIDSRFERDDKQPDIIATTEDNHQYLIEFVFRQKIQHKKDVDYNKLSCLEVDISGQTLESLEEFLLKTDANRRWINNENYFSQIESIYHEKGKSVRLIDEKECFNCKLANSCCVLIKQTLTHRPLIIKNNGVNYRLCKTELYKAREKEQEEEQRFLELQNSYKNDSVKEDVDCRQSNIVEKEEIRNSNALLKDKSKRNCYNCQNNLGWANRNDQACCACFNILGISRYNSPEFAGRCKGYTPLNS